ncbi:hypothetical protein AAGG49_23260, partial [Stenotrophomonas maltophilia]|uniref:hypothetical protein n=1 Tax=Stenotrophomonas maltophilia TaxID=40324 RepID=UPI00313B1085
PGGGGGWVLSDSFIYSKTFSACVLVVGGGGVFQVGVLGGGFSIFVLVDMGCELGIALVYVVVGFLFIVRVVFFCLGDRICVIDCADLDTCRLTFNYVLLILLEVII